VVRCGLCGIKVVISDTHEGPRKALSTVLSGASLATLPGALHAGPARDDPALPPSL
jgi:hypothetical protein